MVIGISGKIGSGKDTVGKILQHLSSEWADEEFKDSDMLSIRSDYQIKKFADKLKDIVCLLIGCNREQLEDREFKEKELGEEWDCIETTSSYGTAPELSPLGSMMWAHSSIRKLTPRKLLQLLGTECGRQILHPNIWVNALFADYRYPIDERANIPDWESKWIITDMRFPNELSAVKDRKGITIRVNRREGNTGDHPSETALDNAEFDYTIDNEGTIEELVEKVKNILEKEGLI